MPRTAGGKVLGISATAPVTIAGEAVRCLQDPAATARRADHDTLSLRYHTMIIVPSRNLVAVTLGSSWGSGIHCDGGQVRPWLPTMSILLPPCGQVED